MENASTTVTVLIAARAAVAIREVFTMVDAFVAVFRLNRWVRSYVARHVQRGVLVVISKWTERMRR